MFENVAFEQHEQSSRPSKKSSAPTVFDMADLLVAYLEQLGVEYVFGVPGGAIEPLYNAIARNQRNGGNLSHIVARHEAGAAFMADGYARETGKIGVCISTSGPGATNMLTAVASAYSNDVPLLVITGQPALPSFGKHSFQESACTGIDVLSMFRHCTRYNSLVSHPQQLEWKLITALQHATRSPSGPVHLSVPMDVFRSPGTPPAPGLPYHIPDLLRPAALVDHGAVETLREILAQAQNVVLLVGAACGDSIHAILQFAQLKGATFVTTPDGKGLVSPQHPLYRGVFGFAGHATAEAALNDPSVDLIIAIGSSMGEWNTGGWNATLLNKRLVHIDSSEEHLARTPMARYHLRGNLRAIFNRLVDRMHETGQHNDPKIERRRAARDAAAQLWSPSITMSSPEAYHSDAAPIKPQRLMKELGQIFAPTTRFLADTGNSVAWATHYLQPHDRRMGERRFGGGSRPRDLGKRHSIGGWLRLTTHFASMGWAIGAAIGTAAANPDVPVVCITGDGSMLMSGQELSVAVAEQLCVIFVILNDRALGMIKHGQRLAGAEQTGYALPATDFAAMARAQGGSGYTIRTIRDLQALDLRSICTNPGPTLLDVHIDPEEVPPMSSRMRVLQDGV